MVERTDPMSRWMRLWNRIERRLDLGLSCWRDRVNGFNQLSALDRRAQGGPWTNEEVFAAVVRAVLSNATDWAKVERILPELKEPFHGFDILWYSTLDGSDVKRDLVPWFCARRAGARTLGRDLGNLVLGIRQLMARSRGSLDGYISALLMEHACDPKQVALALGSSRSPEKLSALGIPLAAEFLKNLGYDVAKPDRHVNRVMGCFHMVEFRRWADTAGTKSPQATERELYQVMCAVERFARLLGLRPTYVDNVLWLACAKSGLYLSNQELFSLIE